MLGAPIEVVKHPLAVAFLVVVLALIGVFLNFGEHGVDQSGQFVGGGGDGAMVKSMLELSHRKLAPSADWLERMAAAASFKTCAARLAQCLVLPLMTLLPIILVPEHTALQVALGEDAQPFVGDRCSLDAATSPYLPIMAGAAH